MAISSRTLAIISAVSVIAFAGCKNQAATQDLGGSGLSSVAIKLPAQVRGVNLARLTGNTSSVGADRTFEEQVQANATGDSIIKFNRDTANENLKVNDNLYTVTLELLQNGTVVYKGTGDRDPFIIQEGENQINFRLECQQPTICPKGSNMEVVQIAGSTAESGATPSILANVTVDEGGMTVDQKRTTLAGCQEQIRKKSCTQWGSEFNGGEKLCTDLIALEPASICEGYTRTYGYCLDDGLDACKTLGVVR